MEKLSKQEQAQPSLLDRLVRSDAPVGNDAISARRLREILKRDLVWLLNTGNLEEVEDLSSYAQVASSVINYGIPDVTGSYITNAHLPALEKRMEKAIRLFEPRILKNSIKVKALRNEEQAGNSIRFEIQCDMWSHPNFEHLALRLEMDMDTGTVAYSLSGEH